MSACPLVSIIMPVYNTEMYVEEAIKSVLQQTFQHFELLIIDDGSTDHSRDVLKKWSNQDERISLFSQRNMGLSATRNNGLSYANGKYIYFMDSDDKLPIDTIERALQCCENHELDFVFFDAHVFAEEPEVDLNKLGNYRREKSVAYEVLSGSEALDQQLENNEFFSSVCLTLISKEFIDRNGLMFETGLLHEDELFSMLMYLTARRVMYLPESLFLRRVRRNSIMTSRLKIYNIECYFTIAQKLLEFVQLHKEKKYLVDRYLKRMINAAVYKAYILPFHDRWNIFLIVTKNWLRYVNAKSLMVLLFKGLFTNG